MDEKALVDGVEVLKAKARQLLAGYKAARDVLWGVLGKAAAEHSLSGVRFLTLLVESSDSACKFLEENLRSADEITQAVLAMNPSDWEAVSDPSARTSLEDIMRPLSAVLEGLGVPSPVPEETAVKTEKKAARRPSTRRRRRRREDPAVRGKSVPVPKELRVTVRDTIYSYIRGGVKDTAKLIEQVRVHTGVELTPRQVTAYRTAFDIRYESGEGG